MDKNLKMAALICVTIIICVVPMSNCAKSIGAF